MVDVSGGVAERAVMTVEVGSDTEERKKAVGGGKLKAVEVFGVGDLDRGGDQKITDRCGADKRFGSGDGRTEIGVAAEDHNAVLGRKRRRSGEEAHKSGENEKKFEHQQ